MASNRLGETLLGGGAVDARTWASARTLERQGGFALFHLLRLGVPPEALTGALAAAGLPVVGELARPSPDVLAAVPADLAQSHGVVPVGFNGGALWVALADPFDDEALGEIGFFSGAEVRPMAADPRALAAALGQWYGVVLPGGLEPAAAPPDPAPASTPEPAPVPVDGEVPSDAPPAEADVEPAMGELAALFHGEAAEPVVQLTRRKAKPAEPEVLPADPAEAATALPLRRAGAEDSASPPAPARTPAAETTPAPTAETTPAPTAEQRQPAVPPRDAAPATQIRRPSTGTDPQFPAQPAPAAAPSAPGPTPAPAAQPPATGPAGGLRAASPMLGGGPRASAPTVDLSAALDAAVARLRDAAQRDEVAEAAIGLLARCFPRTALFVVRTGAVVGWTAAGEADPRAIKAAEVPGGAPSTLWEVARTGRPYRGPLGLGATDEVLKDALGFPPREALVVPVLLAGRVACLIYGDSPDDRPLFDRTDLLERLASEIGDALQALILRRKLS